MAVVDFTKAFDTVQHSSVWAALREQGVEEPYVEQLTKLYDQQRASVHTDVKIKRFHLERGTKQGDTRSTLLLNSLLQYIMKPIEEMWKRCNHVVRLANTTLTTNLSNLRLADDILLYQRLAEAHDHHPRRPYHSYDGTRPTNPPTITQIISNTTSKRGRSNTVAVQGMNIKILSLSKRRTSRVCTPHQMRVGNILTSHRQELTSPKYPLRDRLKLFDATVTLSLLYASGTTTMTEDVKKKLQTTQRRMMRMIIQTKRQAGTSCAAAQAANACVDVTSDAGD